MPPKKSQSSGSEAPAAQDEGVQVVLLLDAFEQKGLLPLSKDLPLGLLPIAGVPAIEYQLETLARQPFKIAEVSLNKPTEKFSGKALIRVSVFGM